MKNYLFIIFLMLFSCLAQTQEIKNRLFFYGGFQATKSQVEKSDIGSENSVPQNVLNLSGGIGYEHYFSTMSGLEVYLGFSNLSRYYTYALDPLIEGALDEINLTWNRDIHIPNDEYYTSIRTSYIYQLMLNENNKLSFILGGHLRYAVFGESVTASNMFYENEEDFSQAMGPKSYESITNYNQLIFNPYFSFRYERLTKSNNSYGVAINFNIPFMETFKGYVNILPEFEDFKSSFKSRSRGGFIGLSMFYSIGFGSKN